MTDPKVFAVTCKPGMEKDTVVQVLNKFLMTQTLQFYSAAFIEKFPGYLYFEADKEIHVRDAVKDMVGTSFKGRAYIKIIPVKEVIVNINRCPRSIRAARPSIRTSPRDSGCAAKKRNFS